MNKDLHKVVSEIYPFTLMVSSDHKKIEKAFSAEEHDHGDGDFSAFTFAGMIDGCLAVGIYIALDDNGGIDFADLAHEVYHAVNRVCDYMNLRPCVGNDEQGAYLTSWIFRWCRDSLKKEPRIIESA